jgi:hypothetical protein
MNQAEPHWAVAFEDPIRNIPTKEVGLRPMTTEGGTGTILPNHVHRIPHCVIPSEALSA